MKIWGSTKKQRVFLLLSITILWAISFLWLYFGIHNFNNIFFILGCSALIILYNVYIVADNIRSDYTSFFIEHHKPILREIAQKFNYEFNDVLCRTQIAGIMKNSLAANSSDRFNYEVIDKTGIEETNKQLCTFDIYADGQLKTTLTISFRKA